MPTSQSALASTAEGHFVASWHTHLTDTKIKAEGCLKRGKRGCRFADATPFGWFHYQKETNHFGGSLQKDTPKWCSRPFQVPRSKWRCVLFSNDKSASAEAVMVSRVA